MSDTDLQAIAARNEERRKRRGLEDAAFIAAAIRDPVEADVDALLAELAFWRRMYQDLATIVRNEDLKRAESQTAAPPASAS